MQLDTIDAGVCMNTQDNSVSLIIQIVLKFEVLIPILQKDNYKVHQK